MFALTGNGLQILNALSRGIANSSAVLIDSV